jgi:hypothetical protein
VAPILVYVIGLITMLAFSRNGGGAAQTVATGTSLRTPLALLNISNNQQFGGCCWHKASANPSSDVRWFDLRSNADAMKLRLG